MNQQKTNIYKGCLTVNLKGTGSINWETEESYKKYDKAIKDQNNRYKLEHLKKLRQVFLRHDKNDPIYRESYNNNDLAETSLLIEDEIRRLTKALNSNNEEEANNHDGHN